MIGSHIHFLWLIMAKYLELAAVGWESADWIQHYYPDDLPPDWRLSYYANEYRHVLVPQQVWSQQDDPEEWLDDLTEPFGFYLQIETVDADMNLFAELAQGLGTHYQGAVITTEDSQGGGWATVTESAIEIGPVVGLKPRPGIAGYWRPGVGRSESGLGLLRLEEHFEPLVLRQTLEAFLAASDPEQGLLFVEAARADFETLQTLTELMGL
jgi:hypothetical protein